MAGLAPPPRQPLGQTGFILLIASLMALTSLAIDAMLPVLPQIGQSLGVQNPNSVQWVITAYVAGSGVAQLFYGSFADTYGRRPVLMFGIGVYIAASILAGLSTSLEMMIAARLLQGLGAAACQVLATSMVRDRFSGRQMARVMSITIMVFLAAPIIAPSLGQLVTMVAPWPWLFYVLGLYGALLFIRVWRMPETLHPEDRIPLAPRAILAALRLVLTTRTSIGYMLAMTCLMGPLIGFLNSSQQIFAAFGLADRFPLAFAAIAVGVACASLLNARIVNRLGSRKVAHTAIFGFIAMGLIHCAVALSGHETVWTFVGIQALTMFCFGLMGSNFGAMAMEPLGRVAGTGSSVQGFIANLGGATIGYIIGQAFDGTSGPVAIGFTLCGVASLMFVLFAERGRLFVAREHPVAEVGHT